jgi:hypothetical protein
MSDWIGLASVLVGELFSTTPAKCDQEYVSVLPGCAALCRMVAD